MEEKQHIKRILYFLFVILLLFPMGQSLTAIVELPSLKGDFTKAKPKAWTQEAWADASFQQAANESIKDHVGFHSFFVRLNNQRRYSLFGMLNSKGVIQGKDNMLFTLGYIEAYFGGDFAGEERLVEFSNKLKFVQDSLFKRGKYLCLLIAPGKTAIYPERIPDYYYETKEKQTSNYEFLVPLLEERGVTYLDLLAFVKANKANFEHTIFPTHSVHWSGNTVAIAADTLLSHLQQQLGQSITQIDLSPGETTVTDFRYTDYDIGESLNLFWHVSDDVLHYPEVSFMRPRNASKRPTFLGIGDSFLQSFKGFYPIIDSAFSEQSQIWFYNQLIDWPDRLQVHGIQVSNLDLETEIDRADIILIESTDENLRQTGYQFIDQLYDLLTKGNAVAANRKAQYQQLLNDPEVINEAERLYPILGYSREKMVHAIAKGRSTSLPADDFDFELEVQQVIQSIQNNAEWLQKIKDQAAIRNITLKENLRLNAEWVVNEELKKGKYN